MDRSNECKQAMVDLAAFGILVGVPMVLGLRRSVKGLLTSVAVGRLASSFANNVQMSRRRREAEQRERAARPAPHRTPARGGLDHVEGADQGPMAGAAGVAVIR